MAKGQIYSNELRKLAKAMNQRMLELEKRGFKSPAYQSAQARLAALGREPNQKGVRRFSETGYFKNKNEMRQFEKALRTFEEQKTSRLRGYRTYRSKVLKGLNEHYNYKAYGLTDEDILEFWEAMPDDERDRMFGSDETFLIVAKYVTDARNGELRNERELSIKEIVERVNNSKSVDEALESIGIDPTEYLHFKDDYIEGMGF